MLDEAAKILNEGLTYPFIFIAACEAVYFFVVAIIYYRFLYRTIPVTIAKIVLIVGECAILLICIDGYDWIKSFVADWTTEGIMIGFVVLVAFIVILGAIVGSRQQMKNTGKSGIEDQMKNAARPSHPRTGWR
ncbi:hypothetical protein [Paenibacillus eucommiae]|uniref:Glucan phosphoethanolaminetransferase (Alkaline phosphatase superfamily) n=1 Tax=Paenibacillus eucommiae TaxID=1355755 RepID=A0ABS4IW91_9BACL|nr:hypothetical protein [Paenibacillus eucommiae]MBP1991866.1 glucan phosphoethanolaminetransferase (alkaline phosphatase superfamily) [Paenibacillus eucommiae]